MDFKRIKTKGRSSKKSIIEVLEIKKIGLYALSFLYLKYKYITTGDKNDTMDKEFV